MVAVHQLLPGDLVALDSENWGIFITQTQHPLWPHLQLCIWKLSTGQWSLDALMYNQELLGELRPSAKGDRKRRLRKALTS